jgi:hypothetical protein
MMTNVTLRISWTMCPSRSSRYAAAPRCSAPSGDRAVPLVHLLAMAARGPCRR